MAALYSVSSLPMNDAISDLFLDRFGERPSHVTNLRADGSNRRLWRLHGSGGFSVVGVFGPDRDENQAFVSFSRSLRSIALPTPEIYAVEVERGIYLEEDLGDTTLFDLISRDPSSAIPIYRKVVQLLPRFQVEGGACIDFSVAYPCEAFDRGSMMWDLNYFKYHFLKLAHIPFNERRLERDFEHLCDALLRHDRSHFLYRDFQSRNIMIRDGEPWFIDYQGGRRGALPYDLASLLYDAKANLAPSLRAELFELYLSALSPYAGIDLSAIRSGFPLFVLIRILQAMGAYGYRGFFERKRHFLASIPFAVRNIEGLLAAGLPIEIPELQSVLSAIAKREWNEPRSVGEGLAVTIRSFSYRKGYPKEAGDHGGGFVFDCRQLDNPGRLEQFKVLTGLDRDVIAFLEGDSRVERFFEGVAMLVEGAVANYLDRGFSSLTVSFGCTGGQHRSVYFAERLSRFLRDQFDRITTVVEHCESDAWPQPPVDVPSIRPQL